jgi:formylglycine-generating enzyme required for sulfatase activity
MAAAAFAQSTSSREPLVVGGIAFVRVPRGGCMIGSPPGEPGRGPKETLQKVTILRDFALSAREITAAQYYAVVNPSKSLAPRDRDKPITGVSFEEAEEFCKKLSRATGRHIRLPYEDEWEYACRARPGDRPGEAFAIWKGDFARDLDMKRKGNRAPIEQHAARTFNYNGDGPMPVGQFAPNAFGLYDMHGNVWEWCLGPGRGRPWDAPGLAHRPIRGGGWSSLAWEDCRSAKRAWELKSTRKGSIGFRVLLEF